METSLNMLILDKDLSLYDLIKHSSMMDKYNIYFTDTHEDMLATIKKNDISIILCDVDGDTEKAKFILTELKKFDALMDVIIIGKTLPSEEMIEIIHFGAKDYLDKPLYLPAIHKILKEIVDKKTLRKETYRLEKKLEKKYVFHGIVGKSPYTTDMKKNLKKNMSFTGS